MKKSVEGFPGYAVSSKGYVLNQRGEKMAHHTDDRGYKSVVLYKGGKPNFHYVHQLVADSFLDNPDNKPFVNHKDGDKSNCAVDNLIWADEAENTQHAFDNKLATGPKGEKNGMHKLTKSKVERIRKSKKPGKDLANLYDVDPSTISLIKQGKRW